MDRSSHQPPHRRRAGNDSAAIDRDLQRGNDPESKAFTPVFRSANDVLAREGRAAIDDALGQLNRKTEAGHSKNIFLISHLFDYPIVEMNDAPLMAHQLDPLVDVVGADTVWVLWAPYCLTMRSAGPQARAAVARCNREDRQEEMAHFVAVRNVLRFVGGPLNFDREDLPFRSEFYPFPFQLAPLDEVRLARYVVAEMPASPHIDSDLLADVIARATGGGQAINRVGALYDRILRLFAEEESLPDSVFRPDRVTGPQAAPSGFPADVGRRPLFVRTLDGRADALSVLADVASQREGESDVPDSHFLTFC